MVISAVDEVESIVQCIHMGVEDSLTKPFERTLLKARINASLKMISIGISRLSL